MALGNFSECSSLSIPVFTEQEQGNDIELPKESFRKICPLCTLKIYSELYFISSFFLMIALMEYVNTDKKVK